MWAYCRLQISTIRIIKEAMREASFLYAELVSMGAPMGFCDVGGGLAVDYDVSSGLRATLAYA